MKLRDWMGRDITTLREDAEFDEPVADAYEQEEEFSKDDADVDDTVTEDAEELEDEEVEPEDDEDAFDKEFMKDDTDEDPVELTSESVNWSKIFK
jgi:hypothetical protein